MDDLINRQMTIATLVMAKETGFLMCKELKGVIEVLNRMPSAQQWIPCSERMPYAEDGNSGILLVTCGYKNVEDTSIRWLRRLWFDGEYWNDVDGERYNQIVYAWMPLPKPYKGD